MRRCRLQVKATYEHPQEIVTLLATWLSPSITDMKGFLMIQPDILMAAMLKIIYSCKATELGCKLTRGYVAPKPLHGPC
jgi:hypothetical protein